MRSEFSALELVGFSNKEPNKSLYQEQHNQMCCCLVSKCVWLFCDSMHCSLPGSSVHGISQAEYWSGLPFSSPGDLPDPGIKPESPVLQAGSLLLSHHRSPTIKSIFFLFAPLSNRSDLIKWC